MPALARWCIAHRRIVLIGWILVLVGVSVAAGAAGSSYSTNFELPGTDTQRAADLLKERFPDARGDTDQIVLATKDGRVTDPAIQRRVTPVLDKIADLPEVAGVASPFGPEGASTVSRDGRIAFATVTFDGQANEIDQASIDRVIDEAETLRSPELQVELGGQAIQRAQQRPPAATEAIGLAAAIVILLIAFGSFLAMGLPVLTALFGLGTGLGLVTLGTNIFDTPDFAPQLAAMIGLGVGIDYALFIVTRFRDAYRVHGDVERSLVIAMDTAGRAVLFAGATVVIALMGMFLLGVSFLYALAVSSALAVTLVMVASLTLLPALLSWGGRRIGRAKLPGTKRGRESAEGGTWYRWARAIQRRPWRSAIAGFAIVLVCCIPAFSMDLGSSDAGNDAPDSTTRKAYDLLSDGFGAGFNAPLLLAVELPANGDDAALASLGRALADTPDVAAVSPPRLSPGGDAAAITVFPGTSAQDTATSSLVERLRDDVIPRATGGTGTSVYVGGVTAATIDIADTFADKLPLFVGVVVLLSALLLLIVFRSVVIPIKAALLNLLSIGAAFGIVTAIFQWGWAGDLIGVKGGPIEPFLPVMMFAIVFGLSMDYEVFLISRMREEWVRRKDSTAAVRIGLATTGRVITAAAAIMVCVFGSFVLGDERVIKEFGIGLATAVLIDAIVIRLLLVPSILQLLGDRAWWLPDWLARVLPKVSIEGHPDDVVEGGEDAPADTEPDERVPVGAGGARDA